MNCSNCSLDMGDGDLFVALELREVRSDWDKGYADFQDSRSKLSLCLVCYDDNWRLEDPTDINFYTTDKEGNMYMSQVEGR